MKKANLNMMLQMLDERNIANTVGIPCYMARNAYPLRKPTVRNFDELIEETTKFYQHMHCQIICIGKFTMPYGMAEGHTHSLLDKMGLEDVYMIANEGIRGGLHAIFEAIHEHFKEEMEEKYIEMILTKFVDPVDYDDRIELMQQYLNRFGSNIPANVRPRSAAELAINYKDIVKIHMNVLKGMRGKITR